MASPFEHFGPLTDTRDGWREALIHLVTPAVTRAALGPEKQPLVPSSNDSLATWFELITRPLWGLAAYGPHPLWDQVRLSLKTFFDYAGTPPPLDQRLVESAAIGYALMLSPDELDELRVPLIRWLRAAATAEHVDNNWRYFAILSGRGLQILGEDAPDPSPHLDRLAEFALSDGWYQDGPAGRCDYYNPFGFHFYRLLLGQTEGSAEFAQQFQHWFAADGSAVPFGRSLGYRFAQGAFWGALAYAGVEALPWSQIRGLASQHLKWWWQQPILDSEGLLTVGYRYPNSSIVEQYIGAGSPYWATKFFLPIALSPDHPFWTATSRRSLHASASAPSHLEDGSPRPTSDGGSLFHLPDGGSLFHLPDGGSLYHLPDGVFPMPAPRMVAQRHAGRVVLLNGQGWTDWSRNGAAKYAKFAYSTEAGFSIPFGDHDLAHGAFDSMLALSDDGGRHWRVREAVEESGVDGDVVWSRWHPWDDVEVETWLIPQDNGWHLRKHRLTTPRPLLSAEGGFCGGELFDLDDTRTLEIITPLPGTNVLRPRTTLPTLGGTHPIGEHWLTCGAR